MSPKWHLDDYFEHVEPPTRGVDIQRFWRSLFTIFECLVKLSEKQDEAYRGLKPQSILSDKVGQVLCYDFRVELAKTTALDTPQPTLETEPNKAVSRADLVYGAPELHIISSPLNRWKLRDRQLLNVWSLGCILSEAATWVVFGYKGLDKDRLHRRLETRNLLAVEEKECFHDGQGMLCSVADWHRQLQWKRRRSDQITLEVCSDLVEEMLRPRQLRRDFRFYADTSKDILRSATGRLERYIARLSTARPYVRSKSTSARSPVQLVRIGGPPYMTVGACDEVSQWLTMNLLSAMPPHVKPWLAMLSQRHHLFLIDDSEYMRDHMSKVLKVIEALSCIIRVSSSASQELRFVQAATSIPENSTTGTLDIKQFFEDHKKELDRPDASLSSLIQTLCEEFVQKWDVKDPWLWNWRLLRSLTTPVTLYVLTERTWVENNDLHKPVEALYLACKEQNLPTDQLGVQYIIFDAEVGDEGDSKIARETSTYRKHNGIDVERWNGNAWKMLLGSLGAFEEDKFLNARMVSRSWTDDYWQSY